MGVWLTLQVGPAFSATLLFLADRETPLFQSWLHDLRGYPHPPQHVVPSLRSAGAVLHGFLAVEGQGSPPRARPPDSWATLCQRNRVQAVVAMGDEAARAAIRECPLPTLIVGITRLQVAPLLAATPRDSISAIYLEADPALNLQVLRALLPAARTVGVFVPPDGPTWLPSLRAEAQRLHFTLDEIAASADLDAVRALRPRLPGLDAVLLPPEPALINEWSLKPLLLMTVRQGVPTFGGLTARYVEAGVLAAVVADEERLPDQIQAVVAGLARGRAPAPAYPTAVRVVVNPIVAQTLGFSAEAVERAQSLLLRPSSCCL